MSKVAIITGGSSGIGKALAEVFGNQDYKVVITGRKTTALEETVKSLKEKNIICLGIQADVSIENDNKRVIDETIKMFGQIDILINNAGIAMRALFEEMDLEVMHQVMNINFFGAVYATKYALPYLLKSKGSIIGISSVAGVRGLPARTPYSASKFALNGFLESLRSELILKNVHVLTVCPGFIRSNIRKAALDKNAKVKGKSSRPDKEDKMMSAETCAKKVFQAYKKQKKMLVLTGQGIFIFWLNKFFWGMLDKMTYKALSKEIDSPLK